jgi:hypothetical protein
LAIFFDAAANRPLVPNEIARSGNEGSAEGTRTRIACLASLDSEYHHFLPNHVFSLSFTSILLLFFAIRQGDSGWRPHVRGAANTASPRGRTAATRIRPWRRGEFGAGAVV